jgi:hypothetical protein
MTKCQSIRSVPGCAVFTITLFFFLLPFITVVIFDLKKRLMLCTHRSERSNELLFLLACDPPLRHPVTAAHLSACRFSLELVCTYIVSTVGSNEPEVRQFRDPLRIIPEGEDGEHHKRGSGNLKGCRTV